MSDLVTRIWSGPFDAHDSAMRLIQPGEPIEVTAKQAKENPGWFAPVPTAKPPRDTSTPPRDTRTEPEP
jgi:hypothetical protein